MNSSDAADQIVNFGIKGLEVVSNIAGKGALSLATFLLAVLKDQQRTKGKTRLESFNGKPTKVFVVKSADLKRFAEEAKRYGVLYAAVMNRKNPDGLCDIIVNAKDAAKVNRIAERFALSTVDVEKIREDIRKAQQAKTKEKADSVEKERTTPPSEKPVHTVDEKTLNEMTRETEPKPGRQKQPKDIANKPNPTMAGTEKSNPSARISGNARDIGEADRPSVRRQIRTMREERMKSADVRKGHSQPQQIHTPLRQHSNRGRNNGR
jgi:hypothetical protein